MTGNLILDALVFGVFMALVNYFVSYRNDEGRLRKSILGGVIAALIFVVVLYLIA